MEEPQQGADALSKEWVSDIKRLTWARREVAGQTSLGNVYKILLQELKLN